MFGPESEPVTLKRDVEVILVPDGKDMRQVLAAQEIGKERFNDQPTAIIYRTIKGWQYGIEGCKSHGAGHKFYSDEYLAALKPFEDAFGLAFPRFETEKTPETTERASTSWWPTPG